MSTETDLGAFEMMWDCPACGTNKLLGKSQRFCPSCGAAQDPKARYFPSEADKVAVKDHQFFGADVMCPGCSVPNSRNATFCVACGTALEKAKDAATRLEQTSNESAGFGTDSAKEAKREHRDARLAREAAMQGLAPVAPPAPAKFYQTRRFMTAAGVAGLLLVFLLVMLLWKKEAQVTVISHQWRRTIGVEKFMPKSDSEWCDHLPGDAYQVSRKSEVRSQKKVADGKTCKTVRKDRGDGTFKETEKCETKYREEPIYDNKCYFSVNRWQLDRTLDANGQSMVPAPVWPDLATLRAGACLGCEREASRKETYTLTLRTPDNRTTECDYEESVWAVVPDGAKKKAKVRMIGGGVDCGSLMAAAP